MAKTTKHFEALGFVVEDVHRQRGLGYDLLVSRKAGGPVAFHVEVKGNSGKNPQVILSRNEVHAARELGDSWLLAVVTGAARSTTRTIRIYTAEAVVGARPYSYEVTGLTPANETSDEQLKAHLLRHER